MIASANELRAYQRFGLHVLIWLALLHWAALAHAGEEILYVSLGTNSSLRIDASSSRLVLDQHSSLPVRICSEPEPLHCLSGGGMTVAFPKDSIRERKLWQFEGKTFRVVRSIEQQFLGKKVSAFYVSQEADSLWLIVSPTHGLLALGSSDPQARTAFLLTQACGFGAKLPCR